MKIKPYKKQVQFLALSRLSVLAVAVLFLGATTVSRLANAQSTLSPSYPDDSKDKERDPNKGLPQNGILSSTNNGSYGSKNLSSPWGREGSAVDGTTPISGSVSKNSENQWRIAVTNNTEDRFSVSVRMKQINSGGATAKTDSYSLSLAPKETVERISNVINESNDAVLELLSWKRLGAPKVNVAVPNSTGTSSAPTEPSDAMRRQITGGARSIVPSRDIVSSQEVVPPQEVVPSKESIKN